MASRGRVLPVIDGDNMLDYFWNIPYSTLGVVNYYVADRPIVTKPGYFISVDQPDQAWSENSASRSDRQAHRIQRSDYFNLDWTVISRYLEPYLIFGEDDYRQQNSVRQQPKKRGYGDADVCMFVIENLKNFHTLMLFAHDKHYCRMVQFLRDKGKKVELYHSGVFVSRQLREVCDVDIDMSKMFQPNYPPAIQAKLRAARTNRW